MISGDYVAGMTTSSRTLRSAVAALALLIPVAIAATPATAAPRDPVVYDALGDSYGSGVGAPPYSPTCGRSAGAYAVQIDGRMRIELDDFVACAGATTSTLLATQLGALDADTELVTVSIGGNDIGWGTVVGACVVAGDAQCAGALAATTGVVATVLPSLLDATYTQIAAAAPNAHVVVTGYPRLFSPEYGAYFNASPAEQQAMNNGADLLNSVMAEKAAEFGFQFVDVTSRFIGHGVNAPEPWVLGLTDPALFHPNLAGYEAYAAAITSQLNPRDLR
jgi:lysophospholipase L1-like esterase